jgi:rare lipoprotein A
MTHCNPKSAAWLTLLAGFTLVATGCRHQAQVASQPPPPTTSAAAATATRSAKSAEPARPLDDAHGKPVYSEVGIASWYGVNYNHRNAADGSIYDEDGMTAAHRTLPMGSIVRVTNLSTGQQILVRITDRGPFSPTRVIDLSKGAALAIGLYRAGIGKVRVEAFANPTADPAGHWCVQTGAFKTESAALDLKSALKDRYRGAKVIEFAGPTGFWVRIDPPLRDRKTADQITAWIGAPEAQSQAYLVRTD